ENELVFMRNNHRLPSPIPPGLVSSDVPTVFGMWRKTTRLFGCEFMHKQTGGGRHGATCANAVRARSRSRKRGSSGGKPRVSAETPRLFRRWFFRSARVQ